MPSAVVPTIRRPALHRRASAAAAGLLDRCGLLKLNFQRLAGLRILCYHGVCADAVAGEPWVPGHFVSAGQFARQMETLLRFGPVVSLPDVLDDLESGDWARPAAFAITFDDVAACTFAHARPVLERLGLRASFYVSTGYVSSGQLLPGDVLRLLRFMPGLVSPGKWAELSWLTEDPGLLKQMTLDQIASAIGPVEQAVRERIQPHMRETLRPLNWVEVAKLAADGHEIGGHTVDHAILGWQSEQDRRQQISDSIAELNSRLGQTTVGFAYPNGGPGDFGRQDWRTLRYCGVRYAVTTRAGSAPDTDMHALPRICIGAGHTPESFALELSGLLDGRRRRQQGWR